MKAEKTIFRAVVRSYGEEVTRNQMLIEELQSVAKSIERLNIEQPSKCLFCGGVCGYPIDDCYNCPNHEWSVYYSPMKCEFK